MAMQTPSMVIHRAIDGLLHAIREEDKEPKFGGDVTIKRTARGDVLVSYRVTHVLPAAKPLDVDESQRLRTDLSKAASR